MMERGKEMAEENDRKEKIGKDMRYAKEEFKKRNLAFIIVKNGNIIAESKEKGVAPFYFAATTDGEGGCAVDRVVGKAVAFLSAYAGIVSVYTPLLSEPALTVLKTHRIHVEADQVVPMILNRQGDDQCPVEQMITKCQTPEEAYAVLKKKFEG